MLTNGCVAIWSARRFQPRDRIYRTSPFSKLEIRHLKSRIPFCGSSNHRKPILRRRLHIVRFQGGLGSGNNDQAVELVLLKRILRGKEVAEMNGVETSS